MPGHARLVLLVTHPLRVQAHRPAVRFVPLANLARRVQLPVAQVASQGLTPLLQVPPRVHLVRLEHTTAVPVVQQVLFAHLVLLAHTARQVHPLVLVARLVLGLPRLVRRHAHPVQLENMVLQVLPEELPKLHHALHVVQVHTALQATVCVQTAQLVLMQLLQGPRHAHPVLLASTALQRLLPVVCARLVVSPWLALQHAQLVQQANTVSLVPRLVSTVLLVHIPLLLVPLHVHLALPEHTVPLARLFALVARPGLIPQV